MVKKGALLISYVLHPLLLPTFTYTIFLYISPLSLLNVSQEAKWPLLLVIFLMTCLAPITGILFFYSTRGLDNLTLREKEDRILPFFLATLFYLVTTCLFAFNSPFNQLPILPITIGAVTLALALLTFITFFWKISAHSLGASGIIGFLLGISYKFSLEELLYPILVTIILAGGLMSARLYLNTHTPLQILAGSLLGFLICLASVLLFL